jgi:hypothetical protein
MLKYWILLKTRNLKIVTLTLKVLIEIEKEEVREVIVAEFHLLLDREVHSKHLFQY